MKKKSIQKLSLKKQTVANLSLEDKKVIRGGSGEDCFSFGPQNCITRTCFRICIAY
jgi:hypothetical protein